MSLKHNPQTTKYLVTKQFYNGFTKVFPKEICEEILHIYFGRIARIRWYNSPLHDCIKECSHGRLTDWINAHRDHRITFLKNNKTYLKKQIPVAIKWYYECTCCQKHQVQKPCIINNGLCIITKPEAFFCGEQYNNECECVCRHKGRWLARTWMELMNIEKKRQTNILRDRNLFRRFN